MTDYIIYTAPSGSQVTTENLNHYFLDRENGEVILTSITWRYSHTVPATNDLVLDIDACLSVLEPQVKEMWDNYMAALRDNLPEAQRVIKHARDILGPLDEEADRMADEAMASVHGDEFTPLE